MKETISYRQSVFLASLILPVTGHMLLLVPMFDGAGRDSWIAILFTVPIGLFYGFILYRLHRLHPDQSLVQILSSAFGKIIGKTLTSGWIAYLLFMLVTSFYALFDFIQIYFLPETPRWVLGVSFYIIVFYALFLGVESITRFCEPLLLLIFISGSSIGIATLNRKDYDLLFPIFEQGFSQLWQGMFLTIALFGELSILLMIGLKKDYKKSRSFLFTNMVIIFLVTLMFLGTTTSSLAIFGVEFASNLTYPAQSIVRLVSFGFIERFDIYGIAVMVVGSIVRVSIFQWGLRKSVQQWMGLEKGNWVIYLLITCFIFYGAMKLIDTHTNFMLFFSRFYVWTAVISVGLPVLAWIVLEAKGWIHLKSGQ